MINPKGHTLFWVGITAFVAVIELSIVLFLVPTERLRSAINQEMQLCLDTLGYTACDEIKQTTDAWYKAAAIDSGARQVTYDFLIGSFESNLAAIPNFDDRGLGVYSTRFFSNLWGTLYIGVWRVSSALIWIPWLAFMAVAVVIDALVLRKIATWRFSHRSSLIHWVGVFSVFIVFQISLIILILPWPLPPIWPPAAYGVVLLAVWMVVRNLMKRV